MVDYITSVLDLQGESLSTRATFDVIGVDSVEAVVMAGVMEEHFGVEIDPMLFSPAVISFNNVRTGTCRTFGRVESDVLRRSFLSA